MCWSAPVSFAFAGIDVLIIVYLWNRNRGRDIVYATGLAPIALQEWSQFAIWVTDAAGVDQQDCTWWKALLSLGTFLGPSSISLALIWRSYVEEQETLQIVRARRRGLVFWACGTFLTYGCVVTTNTYCVEVGPHHHQVWICAKSVYNVGGFPLYCTLLAMYYLSISHSFCSLTIPSQEAKWIGLIGFVTGALSYGIYFSTLEACSVWCWSSLSLGIYFVVRPPIEDQTKRRSSDVDEDEDTLLLPVPILPLGAK
jgi:hypothetical protein